VGLLDVAEALQALQHPRVVLGHGRTLAQSGLEGVLDELLDRAIPGRLRVLLAGLSRSLSTEIFDPNMYVSPV